MAVTKVDDVIVPELFIPRVAVLTEQKSRIINSGAVVRNPLLDAFLAGPGLDINVPSYRDLDDEEENVSTDAESDHFNPGATNDSRPSKITMQSEVATRLSRNKSWGTADLARALAVADPAEAIAQLASTYWTRRYQAAVLSVAKGLFADNDAAPDGDDTHTAGDMSHSVAGDTFDNGTSNFTTAGAVDAMTGLGDSQDDLGIVIVHSVVYATMVKNKLIDTTIDTNTNLAVNTFLGRTVIVDDGVPHDGPVYESFFFGPGAIQYGMGTPVVPVEVQRLPAAGNGGGNEVLYNRTELCIHPTGFAYVGPKPNGGPANAVLADAGSWSRVYNERKSVKIARFVTREA